MTLKRIFNQGQQRTVKDECKCFTNYQWNVGSNFWEFIAGGLILDVQAIKGTAETSDAQTHGQANKNKRLIISEW